MEVRGAGSVREIPVAAIYGALVLLAVVMRSVFFLEVADEPVFSSLMIDSPDLGGFKPPASAGSF